MKIGMLCLLLLGLTAGCETPVRLRPIADSTWFERENRNALESREPSERTGQFLRREDLAGRYFHEPRALLLELHARLTGRRERVVALHLAELCYLEARLGSTSDADEAILYASAMRYAYAYLFDPELRPASSPYDPGFRWACDFYNRSLAQIIAFAHRNPDLERGEQLVVLPTLTGRIAANLGRYPDYFQRGEFRELLIAFNYDVRGLPGRARSYGVGVPLVLVRPVTAAEASFRPAIVDQLVHSRALDTIQLEQSYAATAFLRLPGSILNAAPVEEAWFELHDPIDEDFFEIRGQAVPLEADLTSAIANALDHVPQAGGLSGLFNPEQSVDVTGLFLLQPYDPDKIPVVFVHGLMSSPMTWMRLFNDLMSEPGLRKRYQFVFFRYPTGNPILLSAAILRDTLAGYRASVDPGRRNPRFDEMVVVGHSMGGLLTKLQVLDGGDRVWGLISDEPLEDLDVTDAERALLRSAFYFQRNPDIRRVVFMATPHRGSDLATGFLGWLSRVLITLPTRITQVTTRLGTQLRDAARKGMGRDVTRDPATGVGGLAPDSFISKELAELPLPPDLPIHSILGDEREAGVTGGSDGVVAYQSSHLDGVQSEVIVKSGHNVQESAAALVELRRILFLHLDEVDARARAAAGAADVPATAGDGEGTGGEGNEPERRP